MIDRIEIFGIIHKVDNQIKREIDQIACKHGLTGIQSFFLKCIYDNAENGDVFQKDLEKMFDIRRSSVSTMISCVEKKGYIKRESIPTDKRINKIVLTEEGRKKYEEVDADLKEYKHQLLKDFSDEEIAKMDALNISKIFRYLQENNVYYAKDLLLSSLDLFLLPVEEFINKFEKLKTRLGTDFVDKLGEDSSLIEIMYE